MSRLGIDLKISVSGDLEMSSTGDLAVVSGKDCLIQDVTHRLNTARGDLFGQGDYGAQLIQYLGQADTQLNRALIQRSVIQALEKEPRIDPRTIRVQILKYIPEAIQLKIAFTPRDQVHPLTLVWGMTIQDLKAVPK